VKSRANRMSNAKHDKGFAGEQTIGFYLGDRGSVKYFV
jgi:hypothetical protein